MWTGVRVGIVWLEQQAMEGREVWVCACQPSFHVYRMTIVSDSLWQTSPASRLSYMNDRPASQCYRRHVVIHARAHLRRRTRFDGSWIPEDSFAPDGPSRRPSHAGAQ